MRDYTRLSDVRKLPLDQVEKLRKEFSADYQLFTRKYPSSLVSLLIANETRQAASHRNRQKGKRESTK